MGDAVIAVIFTLITVICLLYGIAAWNYRGPILMNKYLLACDEEKAALKEQPEKDKKADYRYVAKLSFGIALACLFIVLGILADIRLTWITVLIALALVVYSIIEWRRNSRD